MNVHSLFYIIILQSTLYNNLKKNCLTVFIFVLFSKKVIGYIHQATTGKFKHAATGAQCSSICITAPTALKLKSVNDWDSDFVDAILLVGDSLYLNVPRKKGWLISRANSSLDIDEMPEKKLNAALVLAMYWLVLGFWMRHNLHIPHTSIHLLHLRWWVIQPDYCYSDIGLLYHHSLSKLWRIFYVGPKCQKCAWWY